MNTMNKKEVAASCTAWRRYMKALRSRGLAAPPGCLAAFQEGFRAGLLGEKRKHYIRLKPPHNQDCSKP